MQYKVNLFLVHLEVLYHIFAYIKAHPDMGSLFYDTKDMDVDKSVFNGQTYWKYFDGNVE